VFLGRVLLSSASPLIADVRGAAVRNLSIQYESDLRHVEHVARLSLQMFDSMVDALCKGDGIEIRGFGSFSIRAYKEYQGRNPRTGEAVRVRPKRLAFFKVGKELRERVNKGRGPLPVDSDGADADD